MILVSDAQVQKEGSYRVNWHHRILRLSTTSFVFQSHQSAQQSLNYRAQPRYLFIFRDFLSYLAHLSAFFHISLLRFFHLCVYPSPFSRYHKLLFQAIHKLNNDSSPTKALQEQLNLTVLFLGSFFFLQHSPFSSFLAYSHSLEHADSSSCCS